MPDIYGKDISSKNSFESHTENFDIKNSSDKKENSQN